MNKISLFELSIEFRALQDLITHEDFDETTGELIDNTDAVNELFKEVQGTLGHKLDATMYIVKELEAEVALLKDEAKRLVTRATARSNKITFLKELMFSALNASGESKLKTTKFNFTIKRSESVSVADVDNLPREYVRLKREADKKVIKEALKDGLVVDGCSIDEKFSLGVR